MIHAAVTFSAAIPQMSRDTRDSFGEAVAGRRNERAHDVHYLGQAGKQLR